MDTVLSNEDGSIINFGAPSATDEILAFHYGNFDDAYGDGTVDDAAANGRVYANTDPGELPTKFGIIAVVGTASGQTTYTWTPPATSLQANVLVVAGGGGGGSGGGGAGGVVYKTGQTLNSASYTIKVGQGGAGGGGGSGGLGSSAIVQNGYNSTFSTDTAVGGGAGGGYGTSNSGNDGGSGGGGKFDQPSVTPSSGTSGQGFGGGISNRPGYGGAGGGGGAGGPGSNATNETSVIGRGGVGGGGLLTSVFGETYGESGWFAGGGGGGANTNSVPATGGGAGGVGGGGQGSFPDDGIGSPGRAHTGGGGGGGDPEGLGADGGSGVVLVRYIVDTTVIVAKPNVFNYVSSPEYKSTSPTLYNNDTTGDWATVYEVGNPRRDGGGNIQYTLNNSVDLSGYSYTRVGYLMTHKFPGRSTVDWVFCTFDKWSSTITDLRVPTTVDAFVQQRNVTNLNVYSSNQTAQPNRNNVAGRLEIWPYDYGTAQSGLLPAGSNTRYDYDDTHSGSGSYGSFQCHDVTNGVTCLAWNAHRETTPDIGIGNNVSTNPFYDSSGHEDWTFAYNFNSDFNLKIMVM